MAYTATIGGAPVFVVAATLKIDQAVGKKTQAALTVKTNTSTFFQQYQQIKIYDGSGVLAFAGYLNPPQTTKPGFQRTLTWSLTAMGQEYLAKKRVVQAAYANKTPGFMVRDILANVLAAEGVTAGNIYDGPTCSDTLIISNALVCDGNNPLPQKIIFSKAADALDSLVQDASASGVSYYWSIDKNKKLDFAPYGASIGPTIDDTTIDQQAMPTVTFGNANYRNGQYVSGGVAQTSTQNETIVGDGSKRSFALGFQLASAPTIVIAGVTQTVGLKGTTGSQFYWAQGDNIIVQDSGQTVLASAATAPVAYIGQFPNTALAYNAAQVAYQASIDGTSGQNEEIATDNTLTTANNALALASSYLTRYAQQGAQLQQIVTRMAGFAPGQLCPVNMPYFNLVSSQMLLETVSIADLDGVNIWYVLTGVQGPYDTTWVDFWSRLLAIRSQANSGNAQSSTSTSTLVDMTVTIAPSANLNVSVYACPIIGNATLCGNTTIVC